MPVTRERLLDECSRNTLPSGIAKVKRMHNMSCDELADFVLTKLMSESKWNTTVLDPSDIQELEIHYGETVDIPDVEIFTTGTWNGDSYGPSDLDTMVEASRHVGFEPPIKLGHNKQQTLLVDAGLVEDGKPAAGRVVDLKSVGGKLLATFKKVPAKIAQLIKDGAFHARSAEVSWDYKDATGKVWSRVLRAVSLLGEEIPAVKGMPSLDSYVQLYGEDDEGDVHIAGVEFERMTDMDNPELQALATKYEELASSFAGLRAEHETLKSENTSLKTQVTTSQVVARAEEAAFFCERMSSNGKLAPSEVSLVKVLFSTLAKPEHSVTLKYSEDGKEIEGTPLALLKQFIEKRPSAFSTTSSDRTTPLGEKKSGGETFYAEKPFNQVAYDKAYSESVAAGKKTDEAHVIAKAAGLKGGDK